jgi:hypothetical protein
MGNFTREDEKVAKLFGIELAEVYFHTDSGKTRTLVSDAGAQAHPILSDKSGNRVVSSVVVNNGCAIQRDSAGAAVFWWPMNVVDIGPHGMSPDGMAFC